MGRYEGKAAIVTGGSEGLGRAIAERLVNEGAAVLIVARGRDALDKAITSISERGADVHGVVGDVAERSVLQQVTTEAMNRWGKIDVLVNNAGTYDEASFLDIEKVAWDRVMNVDLHAPFQLSQMVARHMVSAGGGAIVNIASIDGHAADGPFASYGTAKAGLIALTKYIAVALAGDGVRCNSISPGWVDTPMVRSVSSTEVLEQMRRSFHRVPIGRLLCAEEIAAAAAFLASDEASGVTGTDLMVDGGTMADVHLPHRVATKE